VIFARFAAQQARKQASSPTPDAASAAAEQPLAEPARFELDVAVSAVVNGWSSALSELSSVFFFNLVPSVVALGLGMMLAFGALLGARVGSFPFFGVLLVGSFFALVCMRVAGACTAGSLLVLDDHAAGGLGSRGFSAAFGDGWAMAFRTVFAGCWCSFFCALPLLPAALLLVRKSMSAALFAASVGFFFACLIAVRLIFVLPAAVLGGEGVWSALQTSWELTRGRIGTMLVALGLAGGGWMLLVFLGSLARGIPWIGFVAGAIGTSLGTAFAYGALVHLWRAASAAGVRT
jgi:hypothetical protein